MNDQHKTNETEQLYPTPTKGVLAPAPEQGADTPQVSSAPNNSQQPTRPHTTTFGVIVYELGAYLAGLFGILLVVALMAAPISSWMISHADEYFGSLQDYFSIMYLGPVALVVFGIMALVRADWIFLFYPIAVFFVVGPFVYDQAISQAVALHLPFKIETIRSTNQYFAAVIISYAIVYTAEHTFSYLTRRGRFKIKSRTMPEIALHSGIAAVFLTVTIVSLVAAPTVIANYRRNALIVRMPKTEEFAAIAHYYGDRSFSIAYKGLVNDSKNQDALYDSVAFQSIEQGQSRKTEDVCGDQFISRYTNERYTVRYATTDNGLRYGSYDLHPAKSKASDGSIETYTTHNHCFVLDGKKYTIERSELADVSRIKAVPAPTLIAAFKDAPTYTYCFKESEFCTKADIDTLPTLQNLNKN